jgi:streptogramin lyase
MYVDVLPDGSPIVSNFGDARLWRIDLARMHADVLVDGHTLGMVDMGNCVVDTEGFVWINEVRGGRVWRFDPNGRHVRTIDGFGWIYDIRLAPDGELFVLDSGNFALRAVDPDTRSVRTVAEGFASKPTARFDGPISLAVAEDGIAYVGDRFAYVVRAVDPASGATTTVAGSGDADDARPNDPFETDPLRLNLPEISSMDYCAGRLYVPTDLDPDGGDLAVLMRA